MMVTYSFNFYLSAIQKESVAAKFDCPYTKRCIITIISFAINNDPGLSNISVR